MNNDRKPSLLITLVAACTTPGIRSTLVSAWNLTFTRSSGYNRVVEQAPAAMPATAWMCGGGRFCWGGAMVLKRRRHCAAITQPCRPLRCCTAQPLACRSTARFRAHASKASQQCLFLSKRARLRCVMPLAAHLMQLPELLVSYRTLACEQGRETRAYEPWRRSGTDPGTLRSHPRPTQTQRAGKRRCLAETMAAREPR